MTRSGSSPLSPWPGAVAALRRGRRSAPPRRVARRRPAALRRSAARRRRRALQDARSCGAQLQLASAPALDRSSPRRAPRPSRLRGAHGSTYTR
eukprot:scaffold1705_cov304-Prasinococcus_capsulatus_cf.AAC.5